MSNFDYAVKKLLKIEGGFVNHPADPGGATMRGISMRFLRSINYMKNEKPISLKQLQSMPIEETIEIYKTHLWDKSKCQIIQDKELASKLFDMFVNIGPSQAYKLLQISLNRLLNTSLAVDGKLGPKTFACIDEVVAKKKSNELIEEIKDNLTHFYINLAADKPQLKVFLQGWLSRCQK